MNQTENPKPVCPENSPAEAVAAVARFLHACGWTPATSSNFSFRESTGAVEIPAGTAAIRDGSEAFRISVSGLDKGALTASDFLRVDATGQSMGIPQAGEIFHADGVSRKPSAETRLHGLVYRLFPAANVILHTHSVNGTVLSKLYERDGGLWLKDFEILKGLEGVRTHETCLWLPVLSNSQDMSTLSGMIEATLRKSMPLAASFPGVDELYQPGSVPGFLLAGHGLYAWGETPEQARRHVEVFEFLFECLLKLRLYGHAAYSG